MKKQEWWDVVVVIGAILTVLFVLVSFIFVIGKRDDLGAVLFTAWVIPYAVSGILIAGCAIDSIIDIYFPKKSIKSKRRGRFKQ